MDPQAAVDDAEARAQAVRQRLPRRLHHVADWVLDRWLGRIAIHTVAACMRVDIFDRSTTIAAQFFTSVFPLLILAATWTNRGDSTAIAHALAVPEKSQSVIEEAVSGADSAAFGIAGTLLVLASATSLSRALIRAFAVIWAIPRPPTRLLSAWRWLAAVLVLALALLLANSLSKQAGALPPREVWPFAVSFVCDAAVGVFVPWILLSGVVATRLLAPGALLFGLLMTAVRPASALWLPRALEASADRYGSIGVAFTYLAWLYVAAFCFMTTAVMGHVVATDPGRLGAWIRPGPAGHRSA
jgi:membrane protein